MKTTALAAAAMLALALPAMAQSVDSQTTTTQTTAVPPPPPPGVLSSQRTTEAQDAYGNKSYSQQTTYRDANGVVRDSRSVQTTVPTPPPPPPVTTTTTTTESSSTGPQQ